MPPIINPILCTGCGLCINFCPMDVLRMNTEQNIATVVYPLECWHCGTCKYECESNSTSAISMDFPFLGKPYKRIKNLPND